MQKLQKIMFATDGSNSSMKAVHMVVSLLEAWTDAELVVTYATKVPEDYSESLPAEMMAFETNKASRIQQDAFEDWFKAYAHRVKFKHVVGQPALAISRAADQEGVDLIVVGSHGSRDTDRLLVGSVSHGVLYCSDIPVLVVKDWSKHVA